MTIIYIIIGIAIGYFVTVAFVGAGNKKVEKELDQDEKILNLIAEKERVTNGDIQKLLSIADSTATKYLQELEDKGEIKQQGKAGRFVYYEKI
ncbi:MAG: winged helix-turn-helix domain-containing protein [Candidatus Pacebacteria bacterium]|nr:winged helix-turn-helix domain-containing protein [Candidatus Paceibacterota bacterium]